MMQYATTNLLTVAYHQQGDEGIPVVLLLHGWPDDAITWQEVLPQIAADGYRVLVPYLRGFGETRFKKDNTPRTGNSGIHALDMIDLLDRMGIKKFSIVGHD